MIRTLHTRGRVRGATIALALTPVLAALLPLIWGCDAHDRDPLAPESTSAADTGRQSPVRPRADLAIDQSGCEPVAIAFDRALDPQDDLAAEDVSIVHDIPGVSDKGDAITFTITGKLFYNDMRETGRFNWRHDQYGNAGEMVGYGSTASNYLAALDMVADIYEVDPYNIGPCVEQELLGSATVGPDGTFSKTIMATDPCDPGALEIAVIFRARFCNSTRCFSVVEDDGSTIYRLAASGASVSDPLTVTGGLVDLGSLYFESEAGGHDVYAAAANVYASLVEATRVMHRSGGIPFYKSLYGELLTKYPASGESVATTVGPSEIRIPQPTTWITGAGPMHEFGHVLHLRTWDGTLGGCGDCPGGKYARDGDDTWYRYSHEYPHTALMEGWANFVRRVVANECDLIDDNSEENPIYSQSESWPLTHPDDGKSFAGNVTKLLCDWYDADYDNDSGMAGIGDHFAASSIYSVWQNLAEMWDWLAGCSGLTICDYVDYYVNERKSAANVGAESHEAYVALIADLVYNNGMKCGLPRPD